MKKLLVTLSAVAMMSLTGCGKSLPVGPDMSLKAPDAVIFDGGVQGGRTIGIQIKDAVEKGFVTQSGHKWVTTDIYEYRVALKSGATTLATVIVPRKGASPKTSAVFTNLRQGSIYTVSLTAWGNDGGSAASTQLNTGTNVPTQTFDFASASNDINETPSVSMNVTFDAVAFNGSGTVTIGTPTDGGFSNPTTAETGSAQ